MQQSDIKNKNNSVDISSDEKLTKNKASITFISNMSFYKKLQYRLSLGKEIGLVIFFFAILLFYFVVL